MKRPEIRTIVKAALALVLALGGWLAFRGALGPSPTPRMTYAQPAGAAPVVGSAPALPAAMPPPVVEPAEPAEPAQPALQVRRTWHDGQRQYVHQEYTCTIARDGTEVRHGAYTRRLPDGRPYEQGQYKDGRREGLWTLWTYDHPGPVGEPVQASGVAGVFQVTFRGGQRAGLGAAKITCNGGMPLKEYTYDDRTGKPEGPFVQYGVADGRSFLFCKGLYVNGRRHGLWTYYYPTGQLQSRQTYAMDTRHGPWKTYRPDGVPLEAKEYVGFRLEGPYTTYHPNGQVHVTGMYSNDQRNGKWVKYDPNGRLTAEALFDAGRSIGTWKTYRPDGRVLATYVKRGQLERDPYRESIR